MEAVKYIVDKRGNKTSVVVPFKRWKALNDDLEKLSRKLKVGSDSKETEVPFEITDQQRRILRKRLASIHDGTATLVPWSEVKRKILKAKQSKVSK
ncbi:MAG: addiction module protein [Chitinophagales bacterium]|nr:addiction module protein [Chitinophagales bacterium]